MMIQRDYMSKFSGGCYKEYFAFHESAHSSIKEESELWGKTLVEKLFN